MIIIRLSPSRRVTILRSIGVDDEMVRVDRARDHGLPEAWTGVDDRFVPVAGDRVRRKHHASYCGIDHALHDHGQCHAAVIDPIGIAVADGTIGPQRGPAAPDRIEERYRTDHVEVGVLLAGEARVRQVLSGGR